MILYWLLMTIHVMVAICLLIVVLLQSGKGGGLAGAFGGAGASQAMFGGRGAGDFLTRTTQVLGATFMATSLSLFLLSGVLGGSGSSRDQEIIDQFRPMAPAAGGTELGLPPLEGLPEADLPPAGETPTGAGEGTLTLPPIGGESSPAESAPAETPPAEGGAAGSDTPGN